MTSWLPEWTYSLPSLPNLPSLGIALPSGIQRRFVSFILRRTLGRFLKPGQLDDAQVDSQIGSGFVQINSLELDHAAINSMLAGLPVELEEGSIGTVVARIPWPNPLSSTLGLSLQSLHLTLRMTSSPAEASEPTAPVDLTESVASMADSFMHDELDRREEADLLQSIHPKRAPPLPTEDIPGGLDPFMADDDYTEIPEADEVSIFSSMVEHLLARFEFDAVNTKITLIKPEIATLTLRVPSIRYGAQHIPEPSSKPRVNEASQRDTSVLHPYADRRAVTVSGVTITTCSLRKPLTPLPTSPRVLTPITTSPLMSEHSSPNANRDNIGAVSPTSTSPSNSTIASSMEFSRTSSIPDMDAMTQSTVQLDVLASSSPTSSFASSSRTSFGHQVNTLSQSNAQLGVSSPSSPSPSDSDMDEETQMYMSQSIVGLPPRPPSPASSMASSLYQSAISFRRTGSSSSTGGSHHNSPEVAPRSPSPSHSVSTVMSIPGAQAEGTTSIEEHTDTNPPTVGPPTQGAGSPNSNIPESPSIASFSGPEETEEVIFSMASEPFIITLVSPWVAAKEAKASGEITSPSTSLSSEENSRKGGRVEITVGIIAVALRACHIRDLLDIASEAPSTPSKPAVNTSKASPGKQAGNETGASARIRGIVVLLLPSQERPRRKSEELDAFYAHPLVPPQLSRGYVRLFVDGISTSYSASKLAQPSVPTRRGERIPPKTTHEMLTHMSLTVTDLSVFSFRLLPNVIGPYPVLHAFPIFITDPHLPSQYSPLHMQPTAPSQGQSMHGVTSAQLPSFDVVDWTDPKNAHESAKLSAWRVRPPPPVQQRSSGMGVGAVGLSTSPPLARASPLSALSRLSNDSSESAVTVLFESSRSSIGSSVTIAPLHIFCDLGTFLEEADDVEPRKSEALAFMEECVILSGEKHSRRADDELDSFKRNPNPKYKPDVPTSHSTPRAHIINLPGQESYQAMERQRLERLVLDDLNIHTGSAKDPKRKQSAKQGALEESPSFTVNVRLPMLRVQTRTTPPPGRRPRSGALVLDLHDLTLGNKPPNTSQGLHRARFAPEHGDDDNPNQDLDLANLNGEVLLNAQWGRVLVSQSLVGERRAHGLLSLGPITDIQIPSLPVSPTPPSRLRILEMPHATVVRAPNQGAQLQPKTIVSVCIPGVFVTLTKSIVDGLQLWADDVTQLTGRTLGASSTDTTPRVSRNPSLIGSRFFARQGMHGSRSTTESEAETVRTDTRSKGETVIKLVSTKVFVRVMLPRNAEHTPLLRPIDVVASGIDGLVELKPDGKDETVVTLSMMEMTLRDTLQSGHATTYLTLTTPRDPDSVPKPMVKVRFISLIVPGTVAKETRVKVTISGIIYHLHPDLTWTNDLGLFLKAPPGAFESVVPSERTKLSVKLLDSSVQVAGVMNSASLAVYIAETEFSADLVGDSPETTALLDLSAATVLLTDNIEQNAEDMQSLHTHSSGIDQWRLMGYTTLVEISDLGAALSIFKHTNKVDTRVVIEHVALSVHLCADTATALSTLIRDMSPPKDQAREEERSPASNPRQATTITTRIPPGRNLMASLDENAFRKQIPEVGSLPDMMDDDLPSNMDYLDDSFGRVPSKYQIEEDEEDDFSVYDTQSIAVGQDGVVSLIGGETIKLLQPEGLNIVEHHFDTLLPESVGSDQQLGQTEVRVRVYNCDVSLCLHDGYDWSRTRKTIEEETRVMRRKLAKIKQMLAEGQAYDPSEEDTSALLFNSVYVGLEEDATSLEADALVAAIDDALDSDDDLPTESSWQSLPPQRSGVPSVAKKPKDSPKSKRLTKSRGPAIEFRLTGLNAEFDKYLPHEPYASRTLVTVRDLEILDHIKTSTWKMFLSEMRSDLRGNVRETGSNMVRVELRNVRPVPGDPTEEARLRMKILPLRLHVDQDALDFLKQFFSFKDPSAEPAPTEPNPSNDETYFQHVEVFPIDIKLDYKPRRVDYRALRDGKTIELMNFFHFDGSEMTLRHITLHGITGWARLGDTLNDLWTPDVKATQLMDVISGVAPIRSVVNVGSGVADLILLPIAQYRKDGRILRGVQKGTTAFMKSTGMEALRLGARLATGTQVILEQAETVLGAQFKDPVTAETLQFNPEMDVINEDINVGEGDLDDRELISRYAEQPMDVKEGIQSAVKSLKRNFNSAAQTILAVPMEVYERSGTEGPVRAVVRAVPIAVLKPMIGATEAVSKTLQGIHNTFDPDVRQQNEAKYKHRG